MSLQRNRVSENLHIILWLLKDMLWSMKCNMAILLVAPAVAVSIRILYIYRDDNDAWYHNYAVCAWITANSVWMISDLLGKEEEFHPYVISLFAVGIITLLYYYLVEKTIKNDKTDTNTI